MPRIPLISSEGLNEEQKRVYDKVVSGPRGVIVGPLRAALHSPELADCWQALGEFLRYRSSLPARLGELAIIVAGRYWNSQVEWFVHSEAAIAAGLPSDVAWRIRSAQAPTFIDPDQASVYEFSRQLLSTGVVDEAAYQDAVNRFGTVIVVELTALIGYYSMVAMTLNAHEVPLPAGDATELQRLPNINPNGMPTVLAHATKEKQQELNNFSHREMDEEKTAPALQAR